ncbi:DUF3604 domain-containing protein [Candidatus Similichlamydia epinepheli]|uniref:DUF3604 domain-containing protein n=1 Tax=Candidatus Similichlamydia epinepheli TaxID=1903953 RepID=UPI000D3D8EE0|nr:DUF3604 domain-containing protein [Candidatus Similichlamydia epinepheli]
MRRSIMSEDFGSCLAGEMGCWKFSVCASFSLQKGTLIRFDLGSTGQPYEWQIPQTNSTKENSIFGLLNGTTVVKAKLAAQGKGSCGVFEFILPKNLSTGQQFQIVMGGSPDNLNSRSGTNRAQTFTQRRRMFLLSIEHAQSGLKEQEKIAIDVLGNTLETIRVLAPSCVGKGKRFDIIVRFEDQFGNPTSNAPPETLISLSYENLRDNLQWRLFVHETGFVTLPNLYLNEVGVYRIRLKNELNGSSFVSPPIRCFHEEYPLFWGQLRGEPPQTRTIDAPEMHLRQFRDEVGLNFVAISSSTSLNEATNASCNKALIQAIEDFNEEDRFVTFFCARNSGKPKDVGCRNFISMSEVILQQKDCDLKNYSDLKKLYKSTVHGEAISVPFLTMGEKTCYDFKETASDFECLAEIYCSQGSSECSEDNLFPINCKTSKQDMSCGSIREALNQNLRFGFCAGGTDRKASDADQPPYSPGFTVVLSSEFNRKSIFDALLRRSCFATTGVRILLGFFLAKVGMGQELSTIEKPGLALNRHITGFVSGLAPLKSVQIIRNGKLFHEFTLSPGQMDLDFSIDDQENLESICLKRQGHSFSYYYLRVVQEDKHAAWSSPIWVDLVSIAQEGKQDDVVGVNSKKGASKKKSLPK